MIAGLCAPPAGRALNRFKVAKHFSLTIAGGVLRWRRRGAPL
jgi:hypothetical protein